MYYHFAILLLFRPLIKLRIAGSRIVPRNVCSQAADAIQSLLRSYSNLYTLKRTPSFVPYFVLTSSIMHLAISASPPPSSSQQSPVVADSSQGSQELVSSRPPPRLQPDRHATEAMSQGIADLEEMLPCHNFAKQALNILQYLAKKWNITVDTKATPKEEIGKTPQAGKSSRASPPGTRPMAGSLNFFVPNFQEQDLMCEWGNARPQTEEMKEPPPQAPPHPISPQIPPEDPVPSREDAFENPLFWPFPMQGRPMIPTGPALIEAGFDFL